MPNPVQARRGEQRDRALQDDIIRYLTDSEIRSANAQPEFLDRIEAERARRFSHFLMRRYYRDRLHRAFRYSANLVDSTHAPEAVVESLDFDSILATCTLGSLGTSTQVGQLARARLLSLRLEEWWSELLDYELAFFIQLATSEATVPKTVPQRNPSAILHRFQFRLPELLEHLRNGTSLTGDLGGEVTLLFSRTNHGRVYVVETDESSAAVFAAVDSNRSTEQVASLCGLSFEETQRILSTLGDIGTIVFPAV